MIPMIQRPDSDNISIHIQIRGRSALLRNTLIGAVTGAVIIAEFVATYGPFGQAIINTLFGGFIVGIFAMLTAWLGQITARSAESRHFNNTAIWNAGWIGGAIGIIISSVIVIANEAQFIVGDNVLIIAMFSTLIGVVLGGMVGAALTSAIAIVMMITQPKVITTSTPHLLNQSQFDPLQHVEEAEYSRRR
jgi:hypothetical protein